MLGEFVGAGEPACCIEALLESEVDALTLIANTPGLRGGFLKARLFASGQLAEFIGTHVGTTDESTAAYLADTVRVTEFFRSVQRPMPAHPIPMIAGPDVVPFHPVIAGRRPFGHNFD